MLKYISSNYSNYYHYLLHSDKEVHIEKLRMP